MLDGQGADEIAMGYIGKFYQDFINEFSPLGLLSETIANPSKRMVPTSIYGRFFRRTHYAANSNSSLLAKAYDNRKAQEFAVSTTLEKTLYLVRYHLPALLHYEGRNSMAHSIEARLPFLDYRLVEYMVSLPLEQKILGGLGKSIIRESLKASVPSQIMERRDKMGFVTSQKFWLIVNINIVLVGLEKLIDLDIFYKNKIENIRTEYLTSNDFNESIVMRLFALSKWMYIFNVGKVA
jgi:asparagine synthase (glutamine-hydrolysing)